LLGVFAAARSVVMAFLDHEPFWKQSGLTPFWVRWARK
jgi:hypothetical protein